MNKVFQERKAFLLFTVASLGIILFAIFIPNQCIYDEQHYLFNTQNFASGATKWWDFTNHRGPTGPGYAWIHTLVWSLIPDITYLRLCNGVLLITSAVFVSRIKPYNWTAGALLLSFPGIWVSGALALTEVYSIFILSGALWMVNKPLKPKYHWLIIGVSIGLACFSRQTLLAVTPAFFIVAMIQFFLQRSKTWKPALLGGVIAILIPMPMFYEWRGLLPNDIDRDHITSHGTFSMINMAYSISYVFIFCGALMKNNREEVTKNKWVFLLCTGIGWIAAISLGYEYLPMKSTLIQLVGHELSMSLATAFPALSIGITLFLVTRLFSNPIENSKKIAKKNPLIVFSVLCLILIVLSNGAITHQFSSRYLTVCAPFLAFSSRSMKISHATILALIIMNGVSLLSYIF